MHQEMSRVLSIVIAVALFGVLVKISIDPKETLGNYAKAANGQFDGLGIALHNNIGKYPAELLPRP